MRVLSVETEPFEELPAWNALGHGEIEEIRIPVLRASVDALPEEIDAIVAAADLQALEPPAEGPQRLIGEGLAERLGELARRGDLSPPERTGILLAGDLYTVPDLAKRGGSGDVRSVWLAFAERFRWVAAVLGNHDEIGPRNRDLEKVARTRGLHVLDGEVRSLDGLRVGGVHGIMGNPSRLNRQTPEAFLEKIALALAENAHLLLLHEGPDALHEGSPLTGSADIRAVLEEAESAPLVVCGHSWWPVPLVDIAGGVQVLKVDGRVVVLGRAH
jgi:Icc-related predicted phosphoesterase